MKEIKLDLNKLESDHIHKLNRSLETGFYLPKNTEIKIRFINFIYADYLDVCDGLVSRQFFDEVKIGSKL